MKNPLLWKMFGDLLRSKRQEKGMTQEQLAAQCEISRTHLTNIEAGRSRPNVWLLWQMSIALKCSVGEILPEYVSSDQSTPA